MPLRYEKELCIDEGGVEPVVYLRNFVFVQVNVTFPDTNLTERYLLVLIRRV